MKRKHLIILLIFSFVFEVVILCTFMSKNDTFYNEPVKINEIVNELEINYGDSSKYPTNYEYTFIDNNGNIIYRNGNASTSLNDAYRHRDTIVDIIVNDVVVGKIIIRNDFSDVLKGYKMEFIIAISIISLIQIASIFIYFIYSYNHMIKPFNNLKAFSQRVAKGNLDIPLTMDKDNNFGAFTEAFEVMREELKQSRIREKAIEDSKKELILKLSHDIKTPVASIKSCSELGDAISKDEKDKEIFNIINLKADQLNTLVNNLFIASANEQTKLAVNPIKTSSQVIYELIKESDYLNKSSFVNSLPTCSLYFDKLRLLQVFDNIFANSYKYASTPIKVAFFEEEGYVIVSIKDEGDSLDDSEFPLLLNKYQRGSNAQNKEGAGIGLFISKSFMEEMNGDLKIYNCHPGFEVRVKLRII